MVQWQSPKQVKLNFDNTVQLTSSNSIFLFSLSDSGVLSSLDFFLKGEVLKTNQFTSHKIDKDSSFILKYS